MPWLSADPTLYINVQRQDVVERALAPDRESRAVDVEADGARPRGSLRSADPRQERCRDELSPAKARPQSADAWLTAAVEC
jgi:hypothetical protein